MGTPQKENGYTAIANEVMESLAKIRIKGEARQVLDVILRKTYGWNKKTDQISLTQFEKATGLKRPTVCRSIKYLLELNVIIKNDNGIIKNDNEWLITYQFNKHYTTWKPLSKKITHYQKCKRGSNKNDNGVVTKMIHTKAITTKAIIQKQISKDIGKADSVVLTDYFYIKYQEKTGIKYKRNFAMDRRNANLLLKDLDIKTLLSKIDAFFNESYWFNKDGSYSFNSFNRHINDIGVKQKQIPKFMKGVTEYAEELKRKELHQGNDDSTSDIPELESGEGETKDNL